jgi:hypothetical protein
MPYTSKKVSLPEGFVDLGEEMKPAMAIEIEREPSSVHYPSLYFSNAKELMDFPKEGTAVIHFKKVMEKKEAIMRDGEEKKCYCVELEIHGIKSNGKSKMEPMMEEEEDDEDAIEKGLKESEGKEDETEEEYED